MKRKLLLAMLFVASAIGFNANAQASYNHTYTEGTTVAAGSDYFLYNIGAKQFLTNGLNYGTRATVDNSGRVLTLATKTNGYSIYTNYVSLNERTNAKAGYLTTNGYVDTGTNDADWVFTPVSVAGYTNAYTIKNSDTQYLFFNTADCAVNVGNSTENSYSYWLLIPKSVREVAGDYSHYLINTQMNCAWEWKTWSGSTGNNSDIITVGGNASNRCGEKYHTVVNIYQNIKETVPNGRYRFYAQGFWRQDGSAAGPVLYANSNTQLLLTKTGTENSMTDASTSFSAGNYVNSVETVVTDGKLKVGINITDGSQWVIFDNFTLDYLGTCLVNDAIALPANGAMTAGKWYKYTVAIDGEYKITATTAADIIQTTDGTQMFESATGVAIKTGDNEALTAGSTIYYKSSSNNVLTIEANVKSYNVGDVTVQSIKKDEYIKSLTTFVLTYGDAATNDGSASLAVIGSAKASLKKAGSEVATGTLTADNDAKTLTATFDGVELVYGSTDYSIDVPTGVFGYEGKSVNAAVTVNFNTPLFADGDYYLKNKDNGGYFAGGNGWGTQASTNRIGHIVTLEALSNGKYTINTHLYNSGTSHYLNGLWCDGASTEWSFIASETYYQINDGTNNLTAGTVGSVLTLTDGTGDNTKWTLLTPAQWKAEHVARLETATADNGVDATFYISAPNFNRNDTDENNKWQGGPGIAGFADGSSQNLNAQKWNTTPFDVYQEVAGLNPGVYQLTVDGFYRNGTTDDRNAILYANDYEVALVNIRSAGITAKDDAKGFTTANGDYFVPNTQTDASKVFTNGYYKNVLNFVVGADGALRVGVKKATGATGDWAVFDNFQLTYYGTSIPVSVSAEGYASFCSEYPLDLDNIGGGAAYIVKSDAVKGDAVSLTAQTGQVAANTGLILKTTGGAAGTITIPVAATGTDISATNKLVAVTADNTNVAAANYVLGVTDLKVGLYKLTSAVTLNKGKAYLPSTISSVKALRFVIDDQATGVESVEAAEADDNAVIYNVNGQVVDKNYKGIVIKNGKKYYQK